MPRSRRFHPIMCLLLICVHGVAGFNQANSAELNWSQLPPLPDSVGFGGMFAGVSHGALIVAGGTNFPRGYPWEGGKKAWYDSIYVLDRPNGIWQKAAQKLPRPLGYGVYASWNDIVICAGGSDMTAHYADVYGMKWIAGQIELQQFPSLPKPCANMCGTVVGSQLFVAGGTDNPTATAGMNNFWSLDLNEPWLGWQDQTPWPGPGRTHAVAASLNGTFVLISGFEWKAGAKGEPVRVEPFLSDAYQFTPEGKSAGQWKRIADLPRAVGAAPTPAMTIGRSTLYVIGGIDHSVAIPAPDTHPGFRRETFRYDANTNQWKFGDLMPEGLSRVTAPAVFWNDQYLVINGESAPGRRSPRIPAIHARSE